MRKTRLRRWRWGDEKSKDAGVVIGEPASLKLHHGALHSVGHLVARQSSRTPIAAAAAGYWVPQESMQAGVVQFPAQSR